MAKKKAKKKLSDNYELTQKAIKVDQTQLIMDVLRKVDVLEQRIDRLIEAISKSKKVIGI